MNVLVLVLALVNVVDMLMWLALLPKRRVSNIYVLESVSWGVLVSSSQASLGWF